MGIDGIGKAPAPGIGPADNEIGGVRGGTSAAKGASEPTRPFEVQRPEQTTPGLGAPATSTASGVGEVAPSALADFKAGRIDLPRYLDAKVDEATRHLAGLGPRELSAIRQMLRDKLASEPALSDLVRAATGQVPSEGDD